jgi:hypothetical protein
VNAVTPGFTETEMIEAVPEKVLDSIKKWIRLGRSGQPDAVARVVHLLCADASAYITGKVWAVNGGMDMRHRPARLLAGKFSHIVPDVQHLPSQAGKALRGSASKQRRTPAATVRRAVA